MNLDRFKKQHVEILQGIAALRKLAKAGIEENATDIARLVVSLSSTIKMHLAVEDRILYPHLQTIKNSTLAALGHTYQQEMEGIASAYMAFSRRWNTPAQVAAAPEGFRADANVVLKTLHARMQKENTEFYPAVEAV